MLAFNSAFYRYFLCLNTNVYCATFDETKPFFVRLAILLPTHCRFDFGEFASGSARPGGPEFLHARLRYTTLFNQSRLQIVVLLFVIAIVLRFRCAFRSVFDLMIDFWRRCRRCFWIRSFARRAAIWQNNFFWEVVTRNNITTNVKARF